MSLLSKSGIVEPTPIQSEAIPALLDGQDVIGQARTGSGKTLAFGLPALEMIDTHQKDVQVLILTPTRELAVQVASVLDEYGKPRGVRVGLLYGGRAMGPQRIMLKKGVHVIVGTPGRVLDMLNQGQLWLDKVRLRILDEADEMLDRGFAPDVERILARSSPSGQTALFSATVPDWVTRVAGKHLNDPVSISVAPNPEEETSIEHVAFDVHDGDKLAALRDLLDHRGDGSIIVFGRTKHGVKKLARQLGAAGYPVSALQGNLSQNARDQVMADFRAGNTKILLATNVAARGLDVTDVEQVINFELPESPQLLTHRIGRTGRMGRQGKAITLLAPVDQSKWRQLQRGSAKQISRTSWSGAKEALNVDVSALEESQQPSTNAARSSAPSRRSHHVNGKSGGSKRSSRPRNVDRRQTGASETNRTRFEIECSACGAQTTVPFEPTAGRPVYCRPCYTAMKPETTVTRHKRSDVIYASADMTYAE